VLRVVCVGVGDLSCRQAGNRYCLPRNHIPIDAAWI
jgi:hypothetical protein